YLEAHGTGTSLGDPIELRAALAVYGQGRDPEHPLLVGSVKTNIGHLEAAAGIAGVIKVVLALEHGQIPKHLHLQTLNPAIAKENYPIRIPQELEPWPQTDNGKRLAGVSSFGMSGTNAHVVLEGYGPAEEAPSRAVPVTLPPGLELSAPEALRLRSHRMLPLSAKSADALPQLAKAYLGWLNAPADADALADLSYTACVGRSHFGERAGLAFGDSDGLKAGLEALTSGASVAGLLTGSRPTGSGAVRVGFLFTGQGGQWAGMGRDLYESEPVFRAVLDRCDAVMRDLRGVSLLEVMFGRAGAAGDVPGDLPGDLDDTAWTQPALYALEVGLTALWRSVGVEPCVVLGHSVGELAAAHAAGVFGLEEGLRLAASRGALMGALPTQGACAGAMAAVFAGAGQVAAAVETVNAAVYGTDSAGLSVAADNGLHQVVSGPAGLVAELEDQLAAEGARVERLATSHGFHSALMDPVLADLEAVVSGLSVAPAHVALISNVTGRTVGAEERLDGAYWRRHAREAVRFADSVAALCALDVDIVLELGPHGVLGPMAALAWPEDADRSAPTMIASLVRGGEADAPYASALAGLYAAGADLDFAALHSGEARRKLSLPGTPFQRERYWVEPVRRRPVEGHPLLGIRTATARGEIVFETTLDTDDPQWLSDHRVFGRVVAPGALYASLAATAAMDVKARSLNGSAVSGVGPVVLEGMQLHAPLMLDEASHDPGRSLQVMLGCPEAGEAANGEAFNGEARPVEIYSRGSGDEGWQLHAEGRVSAAAVETAAAVDLQDLTAGLTAVDVSGLYGSFADLGLDYGASFQGLASLWSGTCERAGEAVGEVVLAAGLETAELLVHPAQLDGCFQVLAAAVVGESSGEAGNAADSESGVTYLPFGWERLWLSGALPDRVLCHARVRPVEEDGGDS
uniref:acyltransferase domain-containing protein n=1 Tax=Yoonia sp. R2-816 TaxID=3342638 RepID=UPI003728E7C1